MRILTSSILAALALASPVLADDLPQMTPDQQRIVAVARGQAAADRETRDTLFRAQILGLQEQLVAANARADAAEARASHVEPSSDAPKVP